MKTRGFTLLEVMLALSILAFALTVLMRSAASSMSGSFDNQALGVVTDLTRSKMNDIEEMLLKEGFTDTDQSLGQCGDEPKQRVKLSADPNDGRSVTEAERELDERDRELRERARSGKTFEEEGWPSISYSYRIDQVELPSFDEIQAMEKAAAAGSAAGSGSGSGSGGGGFQNSALGGLLGQLGGIGGFGGDANIDAKQGAAFIQTQYQLVQQIFKVSIRKVTLCVYYEAAGRPNELKTVAYFTDSSAMDKVLQGFGSKDLDDAAGSGGAGSGSAGGTGSGSSTGGGRPPRGGGVGSGR